MGLFDIWDDNSPQEYDYKKLRKDLEDECAIQSATFSGGFGFLQMTEVSKASNQELIKMAKREGFDLEKYRK